MNFKYELTSPHQEGFFFEKRFLDLFFNMNGEFNLPITKSSKALLLIDSNFENSEVRGEAVLSFCLFRELPGNILEIDYIASQKIQSRKGFSSRCLKEVCSMLKPSEVWLEVSELNFGAIKFYEKLGFIRKSTRKGYYNKNEAAFLYSLNLQKD